MKARRQSWLRRVAAALRARLHDPISGDDLLFYWLAEPRLEQMGCGGVQRFAGWVLWYGERMVSELGLALDGEPTATVVVNEVRPAIAANVHHAAGAAGCGFSAELPVPETTRRLSFIARFADGASEPFVDIELAELRGRHAELAAIAARVDALPLPDGELVFLTQGMRDVEFYRATIVPAALNTVAYLRAAGVDAARPLAVLDFGCGSGRLLAGWHALAGGHALAGCDINRDLIGWARASLPAAIDLRVTAPDPPLPYVDASFDVVFAVSVFTHLSPAAQRRWAAELARIVRPGGALLLTLHGESYLPHLFPDRPEVAEELRRRGELVTEGGDEGSNRFASLHTRGAARRLFGAFDLAGFFPNGRIGGRRLPYPVFFLQDVYVFCKL